MGTDFGGVVERQYWKGHVITLYFFQYHVGVSLLSPRLTPSAAAEGSPNKTCCVVKDQHVACVSKLENATLLPTGDWHAFSVTNNITSSTTAFAQTLKY
jgi:hypothetical protein